MVNGRTSFWDEFKAFLLQGSIIDLATAVIIGGAFGKIVESLIGDIITPGILNPVMKAANVDELAKLVVPGTAIKYGAFLAQLINFLIIALVIFTLLKAVAAAKKRMQREEALAEAEAAASDPAIEVQQRLADSLERLTEVISRQ